MTLETAVCLLAAAVCMVAVFTILCCYVINQLSVKNLNAAQLVQQTAQANLIMAEKLCNYIEAQHAANIADIKREAC